MCARALKSLDASAKYVVTVNIFPVSSVKTFENQFSFGQFRYFLTFSCSGCWNNLWRANFCFIQSSISTNVQYLNIGMNKKKFKNSVGHSSHGNVQHTKTRWNFLSSFHFARIVRLKMIKINAPKFIFLLNVYWLAHHLNIICF